MHQGQYSVLAPPHALPSPLPLQVWPYETSCYPGTRMISYWTFQDSVSSTLLLAHSHSSFRKPLTYTSSLQAFQTKQEVWVLHPAPSVTVVIPILSLPLYLTTTPARPPKLLEVRDGDLFTYRCLFPKRQLGGI